MGIKKHNPGCGCCDGEGPGPHHCGGTVCPNYGTTLNLELTDDSGTRPMVVKVPPDGELGGAYYLCYSAPLADFPFGGEICIEGDDCPGETVFVGYVLYCPTLLFLNPQFRLLSSFSLCNPTCHGDPNLTPRPDGCVLTCDNWYVAADPCNHSWAGGSDTTIGGSCSPVNLSYPDMGNGPVTITEVA